LYKNPIRVKHIAKSRPVTFCAFDIIKYRGKDVTNLHLNDRKELLKLQSVPGNAISYFDAVCKQNLEGIVLKRKDSKYEVGVRSRSWLKVINYSYTDTWITDYRKTQFGWLLTFQMEHRLGSWN
jgi:DNA ligase 1